MSKKTKGKKDKTNKGGVITLDRGKAQAAIGDLQDERICPECGTQFGLHSYRCPVLQSELKNVSGMADGERAAIKEQIEELPDSTIKCPNCQNNTTGQAYCPVCGTRVIPSL